MRTHIRITALITALTILVCAVSCGSKKQDSAEVSSQETAVVSSEEPSSQEPQPVRLYGKSFMSDDKEISLTDIAFTSADELLQHIGEFTALQKVDVTGSPMSDDELAAVQEKLGDVILVWNVEICGVEVPTDTRYLCLFWKESEDSLQISTEESQYTFPFGVSNVTLPIDNGYHTENIRYLSDLRGARISYGGANGFNVASLKDLKKLTSLTLEGCLSNCNALKDMTQMEYLSLGSGWYDVQIIQSLTHLKVLYIYNVDNTFPYSYIADMNDLEETDLVFKITKQADIDEMAENLKSKNSLKYLLINVFSYDSIDLSPLNQAHIKTLRIYVSKMDPKSIESLYALKNIKGIYLYDYYHQIKSEAIAKLKDELKDSIVIYVDSYR